MQYFALILRWLGAIVVAFLVYTIVFALGAMIFKQFGGDPVVALQSSIAFATAFGVIAGTVILPREKWKSAALALWLIALLGPLWPLVQSALSGGLGLINFVELGGALSGGLIVFCAVRAVSSGRKINRVSGQNS